MPIKEAAVLFQEVAELKELAKICPADACLDSPIGTWPHEDQVHIKVFELAQKSLFGFSFYFQNIVPFMNEKSALLHDLSKNNKIYICDDTNIVETRKTLINKHKWITSTITVSDALGFAFVGTSIRKVKREAACPCCSGLGRFEIESPDNGIDKADLPCESCLGTGINISALDTCISGLSVRMWLTGRVEELSHSICTDRWDSISDLVLSCRVRNLPKYQLIRLLEKVGK
jgi:hypothetical protein